MKAQIIQDHNGIPTGVFIPIQDWEAIKKKYPDIDDGSLTEDFALSEEQKKILDSQEDLEDKDYQTSDEFLTELQNKNAL